MKTSGKKMRVCVIGAGVSGLPAIKACLEEGIEIKCYERTSEIGGLWNYRPDQPDVVGATVMGSTVVNTSKEMMAYSDFPPPADWPNFMHHSYVQKYLQMYAKKFDLLSHVQFNIAVTKVVRNGTRNGEGGMMMGWRVLLSDGSEEEFNAVMLCTGHHCDPKMPTLPGMDKFRGQILHAKQYRDYKELEGKNVFLLGIGNSALDIAVDLAKIANQVIMSTRRGTWIFNRISQFGLPYDVVYQTRFYNWLMEILPWSVANDFKEWRCQQKMDHDLYGLRPVHRFFQQHPAVNDSLPNLLSSGHIIIVDDIASIDEHSIAVRDGRHFPVDVLILCTGYTFGFPYLDPPDLIPVSNNNEVKLYKFVFPPEPSAQTLAVIGLIQPIGSVGPISEMQARWAAGVFSGRCQLPMEPTIRAEIAQKQREMRRQYFDSPKHTIQVQFIPYMDELAELVGCKPNIKDLFWNHPAFGLRLFMGPNTPYAYRLEGPNRWDGARQAIETMPKRVKMPLKQRESGAAPVEHVKAKKQRKGILSRHFDYAITKCFALYLTIAFALWAWLFAHQPAGDGWSIGLLLLFISYTLVLAFVATLAYLLQIDIIWL